MKRKWSRYCRVGITILALNGSALAHAGLARAATLDDCDGTSVRVLAANDQAVDARGFWLSRERLAWPGAQPLVTGEEVRLYFSAEAKLRVGAAKKLAGADGFLRLTETTAALPGELSQRFKYLPAGLQLSLSGISKKRVDQLLKQQLVLVRRGVNGDVLDHTRLQTAGVLDDRYATAAKVADLGAGRSGTKLWAPTARKVALCLYADAKTPASALQPMLIDGASGIWAAPMRHGQGAYYTYLVDLVVPGVGVVRNRVTDPYSLSLSTDSARSMAIDLNDPRTLPDGWVSTRSPDTVKHPTDLSIYELHVRDFSINDPSVPVAHRGKYLAFGDTESHGMKHLRMLAAAGMTDVHLLPVFDIASIPESDCISPQPAGAGASEAPQKVVREVKTRDCYNWGYDPLHYTVPEGSYATDAGDGYVRVREFRRMVQALHQSGLRVGMDVVYNHTPASGQDRWSVLDRIVPGYYQRLNLKGQVESSTCCANTATEHLMMGKLLKDSVLVWARDYKIDSFRFDLMAHQPRSVMEALQRDLRTQTGRDIQLIGEGWNFGEVADGARFVQASQRSLNGSGIGTFSDRARDAIRGGSAGDSGPAMVDRKGFIHGFAPTPTEQLRAADQVRVGLAGTLASYPMQTYTGELRKLGDIDYAGQPAGYASQPSEVVNYIENHDNQTLFDVNALRLPQDMDSRDRARVQVVAMALNLFSQGINYSHAGTEILRSKSLDRNSYDSGDWFNRLDWTYQDNYFATGLPLADDNQASWDIMRPVLENPAIRPSPDDIAFARDAFLDILRIRSSSTLFRLRSADEVSRRLRFLNVGPSQNPQVVAATLDGTNLAGAGYPSLVYVVNVSRQAQTIQESALAGRRLVLHPLQLDAKAADSRIRDAATFDPSDGRIAVPALSAVVFVERQ